jgi:hypothetical protein
VTVASVYSLPLTVVKSSATTADVKHRMNNVKTFALMLYLNRRPHFLF